MREAELKSAGGGELSGFTPPFGGPSAFRQFQLAPAEFRFGPFF